MLAGGLLLVVGGKWWPMAVVWRGLVGTLDWYCLWAPAVLARTDTLRAPLKIPEVVDR